MIYPEVETIAIKHPLIPPPVDSDDYHPWLLIERTRLEHNLEYARRGSDRYRRQIDYNKDHYPAGHEKIRESVARLNSQNKICRRLQIDLWSVEAKIKELND